MKTITTAIFATLLFTACNNNSSSFKPEKAQGNLCSLVSELESESENTKKEKELKMPCSELQIMKEWEEVAKTYGVKPFEGEKAQYLLVDIDKDKKPEIFVTAGGLTVAMTCNGRIPKVVTHAFGEYSSLAVANNYIVSISDDGRNADWGKKDYYHIHESGVDYILHAATEGDEDDIDAPATTTYSFDEQFEAPKDVSKDVNQNIAKGYMPKDNPVSIREFTNWKEMSK